MTFPFFQTLVPSQTPMPVKTAKDNSQKRNQFVVLSPPTKSAIFVDSPNPTNKLTSSNVARARQPQEEERGLIVHMRPSSEKE